MRCSRCQTDKPDGEFAPSALARRAAGSPKGAYCRPCRRDYYKGRSRDPVLKAATAKRSRERLLADPARRDAHKLRARSKGLRLRYGITLAEYEARLAAQGGRCACCGTEEPRGAGSFRVDHDHETGVVRGLLCNPCNAGLGLLGDSPAALMRALRYLDGQGAHDLTNLAGSELSVPLQ